MAARAHARPADPRRREEELHRLQGPARRLPVPEEHPPAPAGRVHRLPARPLLRALERREARAAARREANFKEMLYARFGKSICEKFLVPYNEKLYACDLATLDIDAMGRFFPHADLTDIVRNMKQPDNASYNATFTYPEGGAIEYVRAHRERGAAGRRSPSKRRSSRSTSSARSPRTTRARDPLRAARLERAVQPLRRDVRRRPRPARVGVEQGARLQPRLRRQGPERACTGSTTRRARRRSIASAGTTTSSTPTA